MRLQLAVFFVLILFFVEFTESKNYSWDYLMFTQLWPFSVCHVANEVQNGSCKVPDGVVSWTIHGLWKHEWTKHGSCAVTLLSLNSELNYFTAGLNFNNKYDLLKILDTASIAPSDKSTYSLIDIQNGLHPAIAKSLLIHCVYSKLHNQWFLSDVRICLDKQFTLMDCSKGSNDYAPYLSSFYENSAIPTPEPCPNDKQLYYAPMTNGLVTDEANVNSEL